jgi:hypothetical protein
MKSAMGMASVMAMALAFSPVIAKARPTLSGIGTHATAVHHTAPVRQPADGATYQYDDGVSEDAIGFGNGVSNIPSLWFNQFKTVAGGEAISSVSIAYGTSSDPQPGLIGRKVAVCVWSDPNNDGNPSDAVLLRVVRGTITSEGSDTFVTVTFNHPVKIGPAGTSFFVGEETVKVQRTELYFEAIDTTNAKGKADSKGKSWVAASTTGAKLNVKHPGLNDTVGTIDSFGLPGNWLIRATGVPAT